MAEKKKADDWLCFILNEYSDGMYTAAQRMRKGAAGTDIFDFSFKPFLEQIFSVYGAASVVTDDYREKADLHINTIRFPLFRISKSLRMQEAQSLNSLGIADKIITDISQYFKEQGICADDELELDSIYREINSEFSEDASRIGKMNRETETKIKAIGKKLFLAYMKFNPDEHSDISLATHLMYGAGSNFNALMKTAQKKTEIFGAPLSLSREQFHYASQFLQKHVFGPEKEAAKRINFSDPAIADYIIKVYKNQNSAIFGF